MSDTNVAFYRSFAEQALHYFVRSHTQAPTGQVASPANWRGVEMRDRVDTWIVVLSDEQIRELSAAADEFMAHGRSMGELTRDYFRLPTLAREVDRWRAQIASGPGFVVVRGLPVRDWGEEKSSHVFWGLGHYLGLPGAQNASEELLGHVRDYGDTGESVVRQYRTTENIEFHCDAADVVGLLCLQDAMEGGQSRVVSSVAVFNQLVADRPELAARLFEPYAVDRRNENATGEPGWFPVQPCCFGEDGVLRTFYHSEYFRSATRHDDVTLDEAGLEALTLYDRICSDPDMHLDMWLQPGDMQFISNHTIVHARTSYRDWPELERKRHLLRLWLSIK